MIIEITRGVPVDITTALSASDTAKIGIQADLSGPSSPSSTIYLRLSSTPSSDVDDYEAELVQDRRSVHSFKSVTGTSGSLLWAFLPYTTSAESVKIYAGVE